MGRPSPRTEAVADLYARAKHLALDLGLDLT